MASVKEYITIADVRHTMFDRFSEPVKQHYVDLANSELHDIGIKKGVDMENVDLTTPAHLKLIEYGANYAVMRLCLANTRSGRNEDTQSDKYEDVFKQLSYVLSNDFLDLTPVMWGSDQQTRDNRSRRSLRMKRVS